MELMTYKEFPKGSLPPGPCETCRDLVEQLVEAEEKIEALRDEISDTR